MKQKITKASYVLLLAIMIAMVVASLGSTVPGENKKINGSNDQITTSISSSSGVKPLWTPPHLVPYKTVSPPQIWVEGFGGVPEAATVTLRVTAVGDPTIERKPIDVMLLFDTTGSMSSAVNPPIDNTAKITAAKNAAINFLTYLNFNPSNLSRSDRAAVMRFDSQTTPRVGLLQGLTISASALQTAIGSLNPNGGTNFFDAMEFATNQVDHDYMSNHVPVVIALTDGDTNADLNYTDTPAAACQASCMKLCHWLGDQHNKTGATVFTIGLGQAVKSTYLMPIANVTGGKYYFAPDSATLKNVYENISGIINETSAAFPPSPVESMITDVLPPYDDLYGIPWVTPNDNALVLGFQTVQESTGYKLMDICWNVPLMKIGDIFEVQYMIKSRLAGWQPVGVDRVNATTNYSSNWCRVKYQNYQYFNTDDPKDIWTNDTNDASIFVKPVNAPITGVVNYIPPTHGPPPIEEIYPLPTNLLVSVPIDLPIIQPIMNPLMQGIIQPQLMLNTMLQPMMNPITMPNFVGMVTALGMMEKIKVKRKMRSMRVAVKGERDELQGLSIGE